jgi:nitrogen fixation/metabolism regulation signal transduction histidine kinase
MSTPSQDAEAGTSSRQLFRRRRYLIDRRRQLAATVRISGLVLILLITVNGVIAWHSYTTTNRIMARSPALGEMMRASDSRVLAVLIGFSLVIFTMVVVRSIMYTHRTAGAVFHVGRCMDRIADGDFDVTLKLRGDDSLRDLEEPFNRMVKALLQVSDDDYQTMARLADEIEEHGNPDDAEKLRNIAASARRRSGSED